ncbi:Uncharacterized conserved protein, DUF58 family, contains vWF domain [Lachnospiraceae bacterium RM5]|nr:Uncharacterized conserved protein, DUF58 family, contains vWF domain [Lachnospiraceae bacterium RM5]
MIFYRLNYLSFIIFVIAGIIFYNDYALYVLLGILLLMPVISYFLTKKSIDKLNISLDLDKSNIGKNTPVKVTFCVENKSFVPVENIRVSYEIKNCFYGNKQGYEINLIAIPFKKKKLEFNFDSIYCGRVEISVKKVMVYDIFSLFGFEKNVNLIKDVAVCPYVIKKTENIPLSDSGRSDEEELSSIKGDDVSQISQIRDYIPGDKLQNIHWKLSAKKEEIQVKEYSMPYSDDVVLLINSYVNKDEPKVFDEVIEKTYGIALDLIDQGRRFYFTWFDNKEMVFKKKEVNNRDELMEAILDFFYVNTSEVLKNDYEIYSKEMDGKGEIVLFVSDDKVKNDEGETIDIGSERVVLKCLY